MAALAKETADDRRPEEDAGAPPQRAGKAKRTLTRDNVLRTVANVVASAPVLLSALVRPTTSAALREKVMLGVTSINDCRLCTWGHSHWAMANGVPLDEVNQILGLQTELLEAKSPAEAAAILFAQHYAENLDRIDPQSIESLRTHYSDAQVAEILAYVRVITLGSLTGNTLEAVLDRFRRHGGAGISLSARALVLDRGQRLADEARFRGDPVLLHAGGHRRQRTAAPGHHPGAVGLRRQPGGSADGRKQSSDNSPRETRCGMVRRPARARPGCRRPRARTSGGGLGAVDL
jgi:AhpD family alkylhydroperoxidase